VYILERWLSTNDVRVENNGDLDDSKSKCSWTQKVLTVVNLRYLHVVQFLPLICDTSHNEAFQIQLDPPRTIAFLLASKKGLLDSYNNHEQTARRYASVSNLAIERLG
jgi:hypothetical protein